MPRMVTASVTARKIPPIRVPHSPKRPNSPQKDKNQPTNSKPRGGKRTTKKSRKTKRRTKKH